MNLAVSCLEKVYKEFVGVKNGRGRERCLHLICKREFVEKLCGVWGGLANHASPGGVGLIRILCHTRVGRESISRSKNVIENLCNVSRSSDEWQYMGIDCLLLLLKDVRFEAQYH
ncbi:hypothetical protein SASPL_137161 [Salvia splendens]|uniref:Uncharacterized protein n=1 Tax=Salvia splendens TaxID=180675 RepID=A0A8X8WR86_SALSN|nr:hypothetical protein SASPL_137161 [Salvia splendens]